MVTLPDYSSRGREFDSQRYQIFWKLVSLERIPLRLVRIIEVRLDWKVAAAAYKTDNNGHADPLRWPRNNL
jgi:hypothetical protein